jgi:hypothetical protein
MHAIRVRGLDDLKPQWRPHAPDAPEATPWMWTLLYGYHEDRTPTHGYEPTREARWQRSPRAGGGSSAYALRRIGS